VAEVAEDEIPDDAWLATLPARAQLAAHILRRFDADALLFRRVEAHRKTFQHHATRALNQLGRNGAYGYRLSQFLKTAHPKHWLRCAAVEHGGCGGTGAVDLIGQCPKCHGRGYWING
jgi:hypothetical protein